MSRVVITGLGAVAANGVGRKSFWEALAAGKSGIKRIGRFDPSPYPCHIAGEISNGIGVDHKAPQAWTSELAMTAARLAMEDAGLTPEKMGSVPCGVCVGTSTTDMGVVEREYVLFQETNKTTPQAIISCFPHAPASRIASEIQCNGNVLTLSTGCSSGLHSIIFATETILKGDAKIMLAGGADAPITPILLAGFCASGALPFGYNQQPEEASRPFDRQREGGVMAEGAGMLVLEEAEHASRRGARIYAEISGWGTANATTPKNLGYAMYTSMLQALQQSQWPLANIDYICAHAPGDRFVDRAETRAIKKLFGPLAYNIPISSIKSMVGNPLAASGPLQLIASCLAIRNSFIPPTINYQYPDPHCDLDCVPNRGRVARINTALVNLHGIGGSNAAILINKLAQ